MHLRTARSPPIIHKQSIVHTFKQCSSVLTESLTANTLDVQKNDSICDNSDNERRSARHAMRYAFVADEAEDNREASCTSAVESH